MGTAARTIWFIIGMASLGLGIVGIVLPLLPTTPFVLLAAFAFARSSERWHQWLTQHKFFGGMIEDWHHHRAISRRSKRVAVLFMAAIFALSLFLGVGLYLLLVQAAVLLAVSGFILSRPSPPK